MQSKQNLQSLSEDELEVYFAKETFKLTDEEIKTVNFLFWLVYYIERKLGDVLTSAIKERIKNGDGSVERAMDIIMDELYFNGKINVLRKSIPQAKGFCSYLGKINDLRNGVSHGRIKKLMYDGKSISLRETKERMIKDLFSNLKEFSRLL